MISGFYLTFGKEYMTISRLHFIGNQTLKEKNLIKWSGLRTGIPWNETLIQITNKKIVDACRERGYLMAHIDSVSINSNQGKVDLTWYGSEGPLFYLGELNIESDSIPDIEFWNMLDMSSGMVYRPLYIESEIRQMTRKCAELGFPFTEIDVTRADIIGKEQSYEIALTFHIRTGEHTTVDRIKIHGNKVTRDKVILRELSIQAGDPYNQKKIDLIEEELEKLGYFKTIQPPKIIKQSERSVEVVLTVEEGNTTTFDGIIGYIPPETGEAGRDGYLTGILQLNFRNLFGTGRRFEVYWRKPDQFGDEFNIYYEEPWIFGYRLNIGAGLERIVRDTTYVEQSFSLNGIYRLDNRWKTGVKFQTKNVYPDSLASRELRLAKTVYRGGEIFLEYDSRNNIYNPRRGFVYSVGYGFGLKTNYGPSYLFSEDSLASEETIHKYKFQFQYFNNFWQNQVIAVALSGVRITGNQATLQLSDHQWFGGARTVRGYRENQFHGTTVGWFNLEYRFLLGKYSRLFLFNDWGYYHYIWRSTIFQAWKTGYGIGLRFDTPLGIMGVDYGLPKGAGFSEGKIHVGLVNLF